MRKIIMSGLFAIAVVGLAFAADIDRHADFSNPKTPTAARGVQRLLRHRRQPDSPATISAGKYRTDNEGATCACSDGKCPADDPSVGWFDLRSRGVVKDDAHRVAHA